MSGKRIKNEQWYVKDLIHKVMNGEIEKPKYQRKKKWDILPKSKSEDKPSPNEKRYIEFLFDSQNSVHAITVGYQTNNKLSNIDGNNRINAIYHFLNKPFDLFQEYLDAIFNFIDNNFEDVDDIQDKIKQIFLSLNYADLMNFKYNTYFLKINETELYNNHLKIKRDEFEPYIEELQQKLKINGQDNFDTTVKININIFEGYTTDELCKTFEDINKYNSTLTDIELLACRLYNITNFKIRDNVIKINILENLKIFYQDRTENEALSCYEYNENDIMNAYDLMVGFQNYAHKECPIIEQVTNTGLPLFFKIYKALYKGSFDNNFTDENINDFIKKMMETIRILKSISKNVFISNLTKSGKNLDVVNSKLYTLKTNALCIIIVDIIGFINKKENDKTILNSIEKAILFHFFTSDLSKKDKRDEFRIYDHIKNEAGGSFLYNQCDKLYKTPHLLSEKITHELMSKLIDTLFMEQIKPRIYETRANGKSKNDHRRSRKFFEITMMFYFYKNKVATQFLDDQYQIEHIIPFSCSWHDQIDNDRLGNIIPMLASLNMARGTKHISEYKRLDKKDFMKSIHDFIPTVELYDSIVNHSGKKPNIANNENYTSFCERNENIYKMNILDSLFDL